MESLSISQCIKLYPYISAPAMPVRTRLAKMGRTFPPAMHGRTVKNSQLTHSGDP